MNITTRIIDALVKDGFDFEASRAIALAAEFANDAHQRNVVLGFAYRPISDLLFSVGHEGMEALNSEVNK